MSKDELKLEVGLEIVIKTAGAGGEHRLLGNVLGWEADNLLVVKLKDRSGIQYFSHDKSVLAGYINEGIVYGFNSKVIMNIVIKELNLTILEYPETFEIFPLRKEERLGVNLDGTFKYEESKQGKSHNCKILDIGVTGCAIATEKELCLGDNILLTFPIPTQGDIIDLKSVVVNIQPGKGDKCGYGLKFMTDESQKTILDKFKGFAERVKKLIIV